MTQARRAQVRPRLAPPALICAKNSHDKTEALSPPGMKISRLHQSHPDFYFRIKSHKYRRIRGRGPEMCEKSHKYRRIRGRGPEMCEKSHKYRRIRGCGPEMCDKSHKYCRIRGCGPEMCDKSHKYRRIRGCGPEMCEKSHKYRRIRGCGPEMCDKSHKSGHYTSQLWPVARAAPALTAHAAPRASRPGCTRPAVAATLPEPPTWPGQRLARDPRSARPESPTRRTNNKPPSRGLCGQAGWGLVRYARPRLRATSR